MRIFLGGQLNFYHPDKGSWLDVQLDRPTKLADTLKRVGIPLGEIYLIVLNGEAVELDQATVSQQDEVKLFPPVGGG